MSSIKTYIGFANKSRAVVKGIDDILRTRKRIYLILCTSDVMENSREKIKDYSIKKEIPIKEIEREILNELNIGGVKILGITDKNLACAITNSIN